MKEVIIDIHNITSADGWYFENTGFTEEEMEPVACFLLISMIDTDHPTLGVEKIVIGIGSDDLISSLINAEVQPKHTQVIHRSKILPA